MRFIKMLLIFIGVAGLTLALLSIFGNPFEIIKAGLNWVIWGVQYVADTLTGNRDFVNIVTTDPASIPTS